MKVTAKAVLNRQLLRCIGKVQKKFFKGGICCKRKRNYFDRKVSKSWVERRNEIREEGKKKEEG